MNLGIDSGNQIRISVKIQINIMVRGVELQGKGGVENKAVTVNDGPVLAGQGKYTGNGVKRTFGGSLIFD